jgi:hypothetical protein
MSHRTLILLLAAGVLAAFAAPLADPTCPATGSNQVALSTDDSLWTKLDSFPIARPDGFNRGLKVSPDGQYLWRVLGSLSTVGYSVEKRLRSDGSLVSSCNAHTSSDDALGIAQFGDSLCVACFAQDKFDVYDLAGNYARSFPVPGGNSARGLDWDGTKFWVANTGTIYTMTTDGTLLRTLTNTGSTPVTSMHDFCLDHATPNRIWVSSYSPNTSYCCSIDTSANTFEALAGFTPPAASGTAAGIGFFDGGPEGGLIYTMSNTSGYIYKMQAHAAPGQVSLDSLYFKAFGGTALMSAAKSASPVPANRTAMAFQFSQSVPCLDPQGTYIYEVYNGTLRRFATGDGSHVDFPMGTTGDSACGTDGRFIYVPHGSQVLKFTMTGGLVSTTTVDMTGDRCYGFAVVNDTVWYSPSRYAGTYYGYPTSAFAGGSITHVTIWTVGPGTYGVGNIAFDGSVYYVTRIGNLPMSFKRFDVTRALIDSGSVNIDPRSVMCRAVRPPAVGDDSLYLKSYYSTSVLYGCPKSDVPNPAPQNCRPPFTFLNPQSRICMDPHGFFIYEVGSGTLRRHNPADGSYTDFSLTPSDSTVVTDGNALFVPVGNVVYRYDLTGNLLNQTTIDVTPYWYNVSVARDTLWCGTSGALSGYACSRFTGGSITADASWDVGTGENALSLIAWDGLYFYVAWAGFTSNTFKIFDANRVFVDSGSIALDARGLMCRVTVPSGVAEPAPSASSLVPVTVWPNPCAGIARLSYDLPKPDRVSLRLYDAAGRLALDLGSAATTAGRHSVEIDASALSSGVYIVRLDAGSDTAVRKLVLR